MKFLNLKKLIQNNLKIESSPGYSDIPVKIFKNNKCKFLPILVKLFNLCFESGHIPLEWKYALVTPLYKGKGSKQNCNNYRGISVLSPISKIFESLISSQLSDFFLSNKLISTHQHGFRKKFSCETALHELISDFNKNRYERRVTVTLFIDFRKTFDTVNSKLLFQKLKYYNIGHSALSLIENYFSERKQIVKLDNIKHLWLI